MNDEQGLSQQAIDELLATANTELPDVNSSPTPAIDSDESAAVAPPTEPSTTDPVPATIKKPRLNISLTKKKKIAVIFSLFILFIAGGGGVGYYIAHHAAESRPPLEKIIQHGITFEEKNFVSCAERGDLDLLESFLEAGMSVDSTRNVDGWSPLIGASFYKKTAIVKVLLEKHADVNLQDKYGQTALMQATAMGAEDIVTLLLAHEADPNIQDKHGHTALVEAYTKQQAVIAEMLKKAGADPTLEPPKETPLPPKVEEPKEAPSAPTPASIAEATRLTISKVGFLQVGMAFTDAQKKYPNMTLSEKYTDTGKVGVANVYITGQKTPSFQLELSNGSLKLISRIYIYDGQFKTDEKVSVNSTVGDIRSQYTISNIKSINNSLFITIRTMKMLCELDVKKDTPTEWADTGDPDDIPADIKIKSIMLY